MLTRRDLLRSAAATPVAAALPFLSIDAAQAQGSAQVIDLLKMFVPAAPAEPSGCHSFSISGKGRATP